jgi:hypothetical protein
MKFKDARVGMEVVITGEHADKFPKGAIIAEKDGTDNSIKIVSKETYDFELWFWDINSRPPKFEWHSSYNMGDIHLDDKFRSLPSSTLPFADCLGLDFEKVKCFIDKEKGIIKVKQGDVEAKAKKSPQDKWDFRLGMGLALCRLKEKLTEKLAEPQKPAFMEPCHYVLKDGLVHFTAFGLSENYIQDYIMYVMGNTFKTQKEAEDNAEEMLKRANMIIEFCKKQGW